MKAWKESLERLLARTSQEERARGELVGRWLTRHTLALNPFVPRSLDVDLRQVGPVYAAVTGSAPRELTRSPRFAETLEEAERSRARRYPGFPVPYLLLYDPDMPWRPPYELVWHGTVQLWLEGDVRACLAFLGNRSARGADLARAPRDPEAFVRYVAECHERWSRLDAVAFLLTARLGDTPLVREVREVLMEPDVRRAERRLALALKRLAPADLLGVLV